MSDLLHLSRTVGAGEDEKGFVTNDERDWSVLDQESELEVGNLSDSEMKHVFLLQFGSGAGD